MLFDLQLLQNYQVIKCKKIMHREKLKVSKDRYKNWERRNKRRIRNLKNKSKIHNQKIRLDKIYGQDK